MKQEILIEKPPIYDQIVAVFPEAKERGVIFSWGDKIYNPSGSPIPPQLIAHEAIHGERQLKVAESHEDFDPTEAINGWWGNYLISSEFRLAEELPAHIEEYRVYKELVKDREQRARYLHRCAVRLAGPLYGGLISYMSARRAIQEDVTKL